MQLSTLPIRYLLLGAFLLTSLLPTTLITGLAFYEARTALKTEIQHDLETRAHATADDIDRMMFERLQNIASWHKLEVMQDARIGDVDKRLSRFLSELKTSYQRVYRGLHVIDSNGHIIASSEAAMIGSTLQLRPRWLEVTIAGGHVHFTPPLQGVMQMSSAIFDTLEESTSEEQAIGTLVAEFSWSEVEDILSGAVSGRTSAALLDEQGQTIAATTHWQNTVKARISATADIQGFQGLTNSVWRVTFSQHRDEALEPIRRMGLIFIGLLVITILLASFIAIPVARTISGPLLKLTDFANRFIRSPSNLRPPAGGPAEIDAMSQAFAQMIEDLERSKEHLTRAAKLAVVGEMAAAMSHEVRTPLGILRSSAQVLLREPELSKEGREVCGFIISETERLNKLVSTLIDTARPRQPEFAPTDITDLTRQAVGMLRAQADKKTIELDCNAEGVAMAECDREQIMQVLLNLLLNSIQILPEGGKIQVSVQQLEHAVEVRVADNGPGIPADQRDQVFDPFYTKRRGGLGLGLAVVRQIVAAHHGEINVGVSAMQGAEFRLRLPNLKEAS
ncbi:MAG: two-component sensor histidine kinase [Betaproteobacteria bacterium HGW-Betaproteobacteria-2]|nr:MAG: two-component sensor histidine kinase [Betaproteobacteria bacterium HGW-Betaproteobacteria-2]